MFPEMILMIQMESPNIKTLADKSLEIFKERQVFFASLGAL